MSSTEKPFRIRCQKKVEFGGDTRLLARLETILRPNYENPAVLLQREIEHSSSLYILSTNREDVASFVLLSEESLSLGNATVPSVYVGLTATSAATRNTGLFRRLYSFIASDIRKAEAADGQGRAIWFTTATPSIYHAGTLFWNIEPSHDGAYSSEAKIQSDAIRNQLNIERPPGDSPFVLRGAAGSVRYSSAERTRVRNVLDKTGFSLFSRLNIDEGDGDRLLVLARSKAPEAFNSQ